MHSNPILCCTAQCVFYPLMARLNTDDWWYYVYIPLFRPFLSVTFTWRYHHHHYNRRSPPALRETFFLFSFLVVIPSSPCLPYTPPPFINETSFSFHTTIFFVISNIFSSTCWLPFFIITIFVPNVCLNANQANICVFVWLLQKHITNRHTYTHKPQKEILEVVKYVRRRRHHISVPFLIGHHKQTPTELTNSRITYFHWNKTIISGCTGTSLLCFQTSSISMFSSSSFLYFFSESSFWIHFSGINHFHILMALIFLVSDETCADAF